MPSVIAAPNYRLLRPQSLDGSSVETVYRRGFWAIAAVPALLAALILMFAAFEHFRIGSIPPGESIALSVGGPFVVVLALQWAIVVWYGTCVSLSETAISFHETSVFFRTRARIVRWNDIKDVSLTGCDRSFCRRAVALTLSEGRFLIIKRIPEPQSLCRTIRLQLQG